MRMQDPGATRASAAQTALQRFTDREQSLAAFLRLAEAAEPPLKVLHFYGMGGAGKSSLLDRLAASCAERGLPCARFDLSRASGPANAWRETLVGLRCEFADRHRIAFPRFDLCLGVFSAREGGAPPPIVDANPALLDAFHLATALVSAPIDGISGFFERSARKHPGFEAFLRKAGGTDDVLRLKGLPPGELPDELVRLFALDLKEGLKAHAGIACRGVLFLDTYETLVKAGGRGASAVERGMDDWVRQLSEYCLSIDVLPVLAGRDRLAWTDDDPEWVPYVEQHLLAGLSDSDAQLFLSRCGIGNAPSYPVTPFQDAIIRRCRAVDGCHAYALALCADIVENERQAGRTDPEPAEFAGAWNEKTAGQLSDRFLRSLGNPALELWVTELAQTPLMDGACALALDTGRNHHVGRSGWERLIGFSFVEETPGGFYRLHSMMRDALAVRLRDENAGEVHAWYQPYWQAQGEDSLAFFHAWRLAPDTALEGWSHRHADALARQDIPSARDLLTWWEHIAFTDAERFRLGDDLWATAQVEIARCLLQTPVIAIEPLLREAIHRYEAALQVFTRETHPLRWAAINNNLGLALGGLPSGDRGGNLAMAIACYEAALREYDRDEHPVEWAMTQNNLGIAYNDLPTGDLADNLIRAIGCYEAALQVYTRDEFPYEWGRTQNNMGNSLKNLPIGDQAENLRCAIACFEAALQVRTRDQNPLEWAATQNNLGIAYRSLPGGAPGEHLHRAIACYEAALEVYTPDQYPTDWAMTQNNLGIAYSNLPGGAEGEFMQMAIAHFGAALEVYTRDQYPLDWARTQNNLGTAYRSLSTGDRCENLRNAIASYESALLVRTREEYPFDWAATLNNLGNAYGDLPGGDRAESLQRAIACYEAALPVFRAIGHDMMAGVLERNLETVRKRRSELAG